MLNIEKVKLTTGLQTDVSPKAIDTQGNRLVVNPIIEAVNARYVTADNGTDLLFQSVKGNTKVTNAALPSGTNVVIGSVEDTQNNALVYFVYNSLGNHGIYKYSNESGSITTIIKNSLLNFQNDRRYMITGVGIVGNMLYWTDKFNPQRAINMTRDYSAITSDKPITLIKEHPTLRPSVLDPASAENGNPSYRSNDSSLYVNKIAERNLQFAYQYVFIDNEKSVVSPYSKIAWAWTDPSDVIDSISDNVALVSLTVPTDIVSFVKQVRLLVREGDTGTWSIWKKVPPTGISYNYSGYEPLEALPDAEAVKIQEAIPTLSKALTSHRNRIVLSADEENFTAPSINFPITLGITETLTPPGDLAEGLRNKYFKLGGSKTFGLALFDDRGRSMGVFGKTGFKFSKANDSNGGSTNFNTDKDRPYVTINLTGNLTTGAPKAKYFSIVTDDDEYYENYMQLPAQILFYKYDSDTPASPLIEFCWNNRVYCNTTMYPSTASSFNKIHLVLPKEAAFIPTTDYLVRLMSKRSTSPFSTARVEKVQAVIDNSIVVIDNFGISDWSTFGVDVAYVEIFKIRSSPSETFYEITDRIALNDGVPTQTSFTIYGDQYFIEAAKFSYNAIKSSAGTPGTITVSQKTATLESPTPTYAYKSIVVVQKDSTNATSVEQNVLDYSKVSWGKGKPFLELENPIQLNRSTVVRFSNPYVQDSSINGLSSFDSGDEKVLPVDRTPITKLVPVGNNILAVHERSLTTLYVEQSMIKNAEGVEQLVTTDRFIGYDRELQEKIGSYHPESVAEYLGLVFGFDVFRGVVWQYSNEGVSSVSRFGKEHYFEQLADAIRPIKDSCKVIGGIDPELKEYVISVIFPVGQGTSVTLGYSWEKNFWTVNYEAVPEAYAKINRSFISFKDGDLWAHNTNALYNNLYGVQYQRRIKVAVNPYPSRSKNWMALQIATNLLSSGADPEMQVVKCYTEDGQLTYMKVDDFEKLEGVFYGPILKDVNTPGALVPAGQIALRSGDDMLGRYIQVELINDHTTDPCPVQFMNVTYAESEYTK